MQGDEWCKLPCEAYRRGMNFISRGKVCRRAPYCGRGTRAGVNKDRRITLRKSRNGKITAKGMTPRTPGTVTAPVSSRNGV
jgi:hypothetical protein